MPLPQTPLLLTLEEFLAQPMGIDTSKILKTRSTLAGIAGIAAVSLSIVDKVGSAPAALNPVAQRSPSYAILTGDPVFVGAGTVADPLELTFVAGAISGAGPYTVPVNPPIAVAHPIGSPVSIGSLQQELLSAVSKAESYCRQPIGVVTHPSNNWLPTELRLGTIWAAVDNVGLLELRPPFAPIVPSSVTSVQYKLLGGTQSSFVAYDPAQYEVLEDSIIIRSGFVRRGDTAYFKVFYQSGYSPVPDEVKEVIRQLTAFFIKKRGGQAVIAPSGNRAMTSRLNEKGEDSELGQILKGLESYVSIR